MLSLNCTEASRVHITFNNLGLSERTMDLPIQEFFKELVDQGLLDGPRSEKVTRQLARRGLRSCEDLLALPAVRTTATLTEVVSCPIMLYYLYKIFFVFSGPKGWVMTPTTQPPHHGPRTRRNGSAMDSPRIH